jgi:cyclopropane fatty-acyl-phospholipid synthase-like methyltransferase
MSADDRTVAFYNDQAHAYAAHSFEAKQLQDFIAELPKGAHMLDLGCGAGANAASRIARIQRRPLGTF